MRISSRTEGAGRRHILRRILGSVLVLAMAAVILTGCDEEQGKGGDTKETGSTAARSNIVDYFGDMEIVRAAYYNSMGNAGFRTAGEQELTRMIYEMTKTGEISGEMYRDRVLPVVNEAARERTEIARDRIAVGTYDPQTEEYTLPEDQLPGFLEALRGLETEGHFGADYYWGGKHGIRLYAADGSFIEYDGTKLGLMKDGEKKSSSFRSVKGGDFWKAVEPWFPQIRYDMLFGDPWNSSTGFDEPDLDSLLTTEEKVRILVEEVAGLDSTGLKGKVDYRAILGYTEDMADDAGASGETGAAEPEPAPSGMEDTGTGADGTGSSAGDTGSSAEDTGSGAEDESSGAPKEGT